MENFSITPYKNGGYANHPEIRPRKLLLHKKEIEKLERQVKEKGLVLVATKVYFKNNLRVKVEIAVGKPKRSTINGMTCRKKTRNRKSPAR